MFSSRLICPALVAGFLAVPLPLQADTDDPEPPTPVRALKIKDLPQEWLGGNRMIVFGRSNHIGEYGGRVVSDQWRKARNAVAARVKVGSEVPVLVSYSTSGPPYGVVKYKIDRKKREVEFYCTPPGSGEAKRIGAEFFAVPAGFSVKWGGVKK